MPGELVTMTGFGGSGKSWLEALLGLLLPTQRALSYRGAPINKLGIDRFYELPGVAHLEHGSLSEPAALAQPCRADTGLARQCGAQPTWTIQP